MNKEKYLELEEKHNNYKISTEERITILIEEVEYLNKENEETKRLDVDEILYYIEPLKQLDKELYMQKYREVVEKYNVRIQPIEEIYSEEDLRFLYKCIETETYQCPIDAKINVANVVFNRLNDGHFGNSLTEIITAKNQFAYHRSEISDSTKLAVEYAFYNGDTTNGAIAFRSDSKAETWGSWKKCYYDGYHSFYSK